MAGALTARHLVTLHSRSGKPSTLWSRGSFERLCSMTRYLYNGRTTHGRARLLAQRTRNLMERVLFPEGFVRSIANERLRTGR